MSVAGILENKGIAVKFRFRTRATRLTVAVILIFLLELGAARAEGSAAPPALIVPAETGVLLLPALDATADAPNMQAPRQSVVRHRTQFEFISRQFKVLGETLAAKAADVAPGVDLARVSARTAGNLDLLAKRAGADWVVNVVVQAADANSDESGVFKIETRLLVQVWDARRHDWLINSSFTGQAGGHGSPVMMFMHSLDDATKVALQNLVGPYPPVVAVESENSLVDYLAGQTGPVVGDPKKTVTGSNAR